MPSQRAILANIHELSLDPKKPHTKLSKKGSLTLDTKNSDALVVLNSISKFEEEETVELTQEQQQNILEKNLEVLVVEQQPEKKSKKSSQKKVK